MAAGAFSGNPGGVRVRNCVCVSRATLRVIVCDTAALCQVAPLEAPATVNVRTQEAIEGSPASSGEAPLSV